MATYSTQQWSSVAYTRKGITDPVPEIVLTGNEDGVRGRFFQSVGHAVGAVLQAQGIEMTFADFQCAGIMYRHTPDVISLDNQTTVRMVGELKVSWVPTHDFRPYLSDATGNRLRYLLAQPLMHMHDLSCNYGFMTNYWQTIFLRQQLVDGVWMAEYSQIKEAKTEFNPGTIISVKQCFFHMACRASESGPDEPINNTLMMTGL